MTNGILIIAHAPLASALKQCVLHVFENSADSAATVQAIDVQPNAPADETLAIAKITLAQMRTTHTLMLTDVFGATPCNVAQKLVDGVTSRLIAGVNLPMLLRAITYRTEPLDAMMSRAMAGGTQGVMPVAVAAPQNQVRKKNDQEIHQHQQ
jgi:mannose PTS system EIIA component